MTETTQDSWKHKVPSMLLAQVTAYVLLIAATVIPTPGTTPIIPMIVVALVLAAFIASWPFRGTMLDRVTTVVFGVISLVFVVAPFPSGGIAPQHIAVDGKGASLSSDSFPVSCRHFRSGFHCRGRLVLPA